MKKFFAIVAILGLFCTVQMNAAPKSEKKANKTEVKTEVNKDAEVADTLQQDSANVAAATPAPAAPKKADKKDEVKEEGGVAGIHKELKKKFIEGDAAFMSLVAIAMVIGLAFCIERIVYLSMAQVNTKKLMAAIADALANNDVEGAKEICRNTAGPVASICYQGLLRIDEGIDTVERSIVSYGSLQSSMLERNCSWITLFIAMAPSLGFLGTVIGMVQAFDDIQKAGDISPTIVAGGMKVALITTLYGIIVALILQVFYNFILTKIEALTSDMEDCSITLLDLLIKFDIKK